MDRSQSSSSPLALAFAVSVCLHAAALTIANVLQHRHATMPPMVLQAHLRMPPADPTPAPEATAEQVVPPQPEPQRAPSVRPSSREPTVARKPRKTPDNVASAHSPEPQMETPQPPAASSAEAVPARAPLQAPVAATAQGSVAVSPPEFGAAYLRNPQPPYPLVSRRNGESGTVLLKVLVSKEGLAGRVDLDRSSGFPALDHAALDAVKRWRFVPAKRGEEPLEAWVRVPVIFRLEGD